MPARCVKAAGDWILPPSAGRHRGSRGCTSSIRTRPTTRRREYRAGRQPYDAEVAYTDAMLGRLLDRLRGALARWIEP